MSALLTYSPTPHPLKLHFTPTHFLSVRTFAFVSYYMRKTTFATVSITTLKHRTDPHSISNHRANNRHSGHTARRAHVSTFLYRVPPAACMLHGCHDTRRGHGRPATGQRAASAAWVMHGCLLI